MERSPGRLAFAASGVTGILGTYLGGDPAARRAVREQLDDVVAACVAALAA